MPPPSFWSLGLTLTIAISLTDLLHLRPYSSPNHSPHCSQCDLHNIYKTPMWLDHTHPTLLKIFLLVPLTLKINTRILCIAFKNLHDWLLLSLQSYLTPLSTFTLHSSYTRLPLYLPYCFPQPQALGAMLARPVCNSLLHNSHSRIWLISVYPSDPNSKLPPSWQPSLSYRLDQTLTYTHNPFHPSPVFQTTYDSNLWLFYHNNSPTKASYWWAGTGSVLLTIISPELSIMPSTLQVVHKSDE